MESKNQGASGRPQPLIGFVLSSEQFRVDELVEFAPAAEQAGFDAVWTSDHFQPWQDNQGHSSQAWVTLAAVGQRTQRILMGTGVTCPTYRYNPAIVAEAFASLGILAPGRVFLGVGSGEALNEAASGGGWGDFKERNERVVEAIELIRRLWSGERVEHQGEYYQVHARLYDVPSSQVPIYLAASGQESVRSAAKHADGLVTDAERALQPELRQAFEDGARSAGKNTANLAIVAEQMVIVGDESVAQQYVPLWRFMPKAWDLYVDNPDPRDIQRRAEQDVPLEEVYGSWPVSEDPQVHVAALQKLIDGGVTHIFVHSCQPDQRRVIEFYGQDVLPKLQRSTVVAQ